MKMHEWCSGTLQMQHCDEYPLHMFSWKNKKNVYAFCLKRKKKKGYLKVRMTVYVKVFILEPLSQCTPNFERLYVL